MYQRSLKAPLRHKSSFFLFGPRGTGKTFWIRTNIPNALIFDLLHEDTYQMFLARPSALEEKIPPSFDDWIVIDEIQKIPALLNEVHRLIESKRYRFILTGSSARKLRRKGVNLLAGRAHSYKMFPLTVEELGEEFNLEKSLEYGHLPQAYERPDEAKKYLSSYIANYLREEVQQEGLTRNLGAFRRFLEVASFSQAQVLNVSNVANEAMIDRKVAESYFTILEDLLIANRLPVFTKRAKRKTIAHPKFYYFDVGVYRQIRPKGPLDGVEELEGIGLETLIYQELLAVNEYHEMEYELFFWRTADQVEVDFILYGPRGLIAIEVKRSRSIRPIDLRGLEAFRAEYPIAKLLCFHGGSDRSYIGNVEVIPVQEALKSLSEIIK